MFLFLIHIHSHRKDFDAVGEVLLSPRQIGLTELPESWVNMIRSSFTNEDEPFFGAPSRVTIQHLSDDSFFINNYNQETITLNILLPQAAGYIDGFSGEKISTGGKNIEFQMKPRTRIWLTSSNQ